MSKLTIVTFLKSWRGYAKGETAGFDATKATDLTESGVAELLLKKGSKAASASKSRTASGGKSDTTLPPEKEEEQEQDEQEDGEDKDTDDDAEAKP